MSQYEIQVGTLAIATRNASVCDVGERGVCYELYQLGNRPGYSFLFESGRYDGFSPDDVELMLRLTGQVCDAVSCYQFENVLQLSLDFKRGLFAPAFLAGNTIPA